MAEILNRTEFSKDRRGVAVLEPPDQTEQMAACFDLLPQPTVVMDCDHTILYLNPAAAQLAGRSQASCTGAKYFDLYDSQACRENKCAAAQAINTATTMTVESAVRIQGKEMVMRVAAAPRLDDAKNVVGCVTTLTDVTESALFRTELAQTV